MLILYSSKLLLIKHWSHTDIALRLNSIAATETNCERTISMQGFIAKNQNLTYLMQGSYIYKINKN